MKRRIQGWMAAAVLVLWGGGCATVQPPAPHLPLASPPVPQAEVSQVAIPLKVSLSSIRDLLETFVPQQFTDKSSFDLPLDWGPFHAQPAVSAEYTVTRGPFEVSVVDGQLALGAKVDGQIALTLKADPHVHSTGQSTVRLGLRGTLGWERNQNLRVKWTKDLAIESAEAILGYHLEFRMGDVAMSKDLQVPIPARALVEKQLTPLLDKMVDALNGQANSMSFAQEFRQAWTVLGTTVPLDVRGNRLTMRPLSLVSSGLTSDGTNLHLRVGAQVSSKVEEGPASKPVPGPMSDIVAGTEDGFRIPWRAALPYTTVAAEVRQRFRGRPLVLGPGGPAEFIVDKVTLSGTGNLLVVGVDFRSKTPDANGRMYLVGTLSAGATGVVVAQAQLAADTRDVLKDRLAPLAAPAVIAAITASLNAVLRDLSTQTLADARRALDQTFAGRTLAPGAVLKAKWDEVSLTGVPPAADQFLFDLIAKGNATLEMDGLHFVPKADRP